jgi:hypothetical protein
MRSISIQEAIDEYRTYNRAQNYSPSYVASGRTPTRSPTSGLRRAWEATTNPRMPEGGQRYSPTGR